MERMEWNPYYPFIKICLNVNLKMGTKRREKRKIQFSILSPYRTELSQTKHLYTLIFEFIFKFISTFSLLFSYSHYYSFWRHVILSSLEFYYLKYDEAEGMCERLKALRWVEQNQRMKMPSDSHNPNTSCRHSFPINEVLRFIPLPYPR